VFPGSDIGVLGAAWRDFPFYGVWRYDSQDWFCHMDLCSPCSDFLQSNRNTESLQGRCPKQGDAQARQLGRRDGE
jgi:hypothetical protein